MRYHADRRAVLLGAAGLLTLASTSDAKDNTMTATRSSRRPLLHGGSPSARKLTTRPGAPASTASPTTPPTTWALPTSTAGRPFAAEGWQCIAAGGGPCAEVCRGGGMGRRWGQRVLERMQRQHEPCRVCNSCTNINNLPSFCVSSI